MLCRCQAQGNNTFDQFMQWGKGWLKKTLAPSQRRRPREEAHAEDSSDIEEQRQSLQAQTSVSAEPVDLSEDEDSPEATSSLSAEMEQRVSDYRHMAMTGREITEDWPPPGTPSWSDWLKVALSMFVINAALKSPMQSIFSSPKRTENFSRSLCQGLAAPNKSFLLSKSQDQEGRNRPCPINAKSMSSLTSSASCRFWKERIFIKICFDMLSEHRGCCLTSLSARKYQLYVASPAGHMGQLFPRDYSFRARGGDGACCGSRRLCCCCPGQVKAGRNLPE